MDGEEQQDRFSTGTIESADHQADWKADSVVTESEYRTVFETIEDGVFIFDVEHDGDDVSFSFRQNNAAHEGLTSITVDEFAGASPEEILGAEGGTEVTEKYRRCVEAGEPIEYEESIDHPTETVTWHTKLTPLFEDGEVMRIVGVARDITEQKERERELRRKRKRLRALFENAPNGIIIHDAAGRILDSNETIRDNLGYTHEELSSMDVFDIDVSLEEEPIKSEWQSMEVGSMQRLEVEGIHRRKDGSTFPVEVWVSKVSETDADAHRFVALIRDVTDRKEYERQLEYREAKYRNLFEGSRDALMLLDRDGFFDCNEAALELFGLDSVDAFTDHTPAELSPPKQPAGTDTDIAAQKHIEQAFEDGTASFEWTHRRADGTEFDAEVKLSRFDVDGEPVLHAIVRDISDRKAYEQRLSTLHDATRRIINAESKQEVADITVDASEHLLDFSLPTVWYPTADGTELSLAATSTDLQTLLDEATTSDPIHSSDSWLWDAIESGETVVRSQIRRNDLAADVPLQSAILIPLGDHGILGCGARGETEFSDREIRVAEILAQNVQTALDQLEQRAAAKRQKAFTEDLLDAIEDVVYVLDTSGNLEEWNAALEAVTGYQSEAIDSMNVTDFFAEDAAETVEAAVEESFETGRTRFKLDFVTADGESIPYEFIANTFDDPTGKPVVAGIGRDRSVHVEYEERLEAQRDFFERTIESLPYPFYVLNVDDYTIEHANSMAAVSEGETCYKVTHNREQPCDAGEPAIACPLTSVSASGESETVEHVHYDEDGTERIYRVYASPIFDADGSVVQMAESNIEITERVEYERRLEEQRDNLRILNQVVRHDIRNDMTVVKGRANLLDEYVDPAGRENIEALLEATENAIELTKTARDLSETMMSTEADVESVALDTHLTPPIENARTKFDDAVITVDERIPAVTVRGNELLEAVFRNLVQNAVVHNDSAVPTVEISFTADEHSLTVAIADNGPGIPDDRKESIFGKGEKGLDSPGTGIGLYLVRTLVDQYGGDVWVEDNDPEGSVFYVELPRVEPEASRW